jgi:signal transduction histidine kinase
MVQHNVDRIATQSLDILSFAKKRTPERKRINLESLFQETLDGASTTARDNDVTLESDIDPEARFLEADPKLMGQVLTVLVDNAIEACLENESDSGHRVVLRASKDGDRVRIEVCDDGAGMSEEVREHIFEDFYTTKGSMGTGLGLVVVRKIISEHGGSVEFESAPGEGTTFTIHLPGENG